ncbi:FAD-binding oxidoreductase [bacterium]|nr:FAD-binding oxidoreductase [bacterium]
MAVESLSWVHFPRAVEEIEAVYALARRTGKPIALRGAGRSYGDASIGEDSIVLDISKMNRIIDWNPETGRMEMEPGLAIGDLWKHIIPDGWWPPIVSGTMYPTIAGAAGMNIHGKNNFKAGTWGRHIIEFDILLPNGEHKTCSREQNSELFFAAIGGFGMLGCFTRFVMQMKKVRSGNVWVEAFNTYSLQEMVDEIEDRVDESDYLVGWVDCFPGGRSLGRGIVHQAGYTVEEDPRRLRESLQVAAQELPEHIMGVFPKSLMYLFLTPFVNDLGMRAINFAKFYSGILQPRGHRYYQSHAAFAFLLDYVPNWQWSYKPGGLIQYQSFVPKENAVRTHETLIRMSKAAGMPSYLGVFKKHIPDTDPFLIRHAVDGYSLAMDFRVTRSNRQRLWKLTHEMDRVVLDNGGRFYFAKDATMRPGTPARFLPKGNLEKFIALKNECDPENILQTDLSRRIFGKDFDR